MKQQFITQKMYTILKVTYYPFTTDLLQCQNICGSNYSK